MTLTNPLTYLWGVVVLSFAQLNSLTSSKIVMPSLGPAKAFAADPPPIRNIALEDVFFEPDDDEGEEGDDEDSDQGEDDDDDDDDDDIEEQSPSAKPKQRSKFYEMTEEEQLQLAMAESLNEQQTDNTPDIQDVPIPEEPPFELCYLQVCFSHTQRESSACL
jgi:hypothetical protein